jgi:hypothetical protein
MRTVTQELLDGLLQAWEVASEKAMLEQAAWAEVIKSHKALIQSLRECGHSWSQAQARYAALSDSHAKALKAAWEDMDVKCTEYMVHLELYKKQGLSN